MRLGNNSWEDSNVTPGVTYYYWVRYRLDYPPITSVYGTYTYSFLSDPSDVVTAFLVAAPANVVASKGTSSTAVNLSWTASTGATGYTVWRNTTNSSSGATQIGSTTTASYSDTSATAGTTYYYWIKAVGEDDDVSEFSEVASGYRKSGSIWGPGEGGGGYGH